MINSVSPIRAYQPVSVAKKPAFGNIPTGKILREAGQDLGKVIIPEELTKQGFPKIEPLTDYDVIIAKNDPGSTFYKLSIGIKGAKKALEEWSFMFNNPETGYDLKELIETFPLLVKRRASRRNHETMKLGSSL